MYVKKSDPSLKKKKFSYIKLLKTIDDKQNQCLYTGAGGQQGLIGRQPEAPPLFRAAF